jgi:hypothetical protein
VTQTDGAQNHWTLCFNAFLSTLLVVAACSSSTTAQRSAVDDPTPSERARSGDQAKLRELDDRFKALYRKVEELDRENKRQLEAIAAVGKEVDAADGQERERLEADLAVLVENRAKTERNWRKESHALNDLDWRLSKLREIDRLGTELTRLRAKKENESQLLRQLEVEWGSRQSKLVKTLVISRIAQIGLEQAMHPEQRLSPVMRESLRKDGVDLKKIIDPTEGSITVVVEAAKSCKEKADRSWTEAERLWDRTASTRRQIIEIEVTMELARVQMEALEGSRPEWDRDNPPQS